VRSAWCFDSSGCGGVSERCHLIHWRAWGLSGRCCSKHRTSRTDGEPNAVTRADQLKKICLGGLASGRHLAGSFSKMVSKPRADVSSFYGSGGRLWNQWAAVGPSIVLAMKGLHRSSFTRNAPFQCAGNFAQSLRIAHEVGIMFRTCGISEPSKRWNAVERAEANRFQ